MMPQKVQALFDFIDYLDKNKREYIEKYIPLCNELKILVNQRNVLNPSKNYNDKQQYDKIQDQIKEKFSPITSNIYTPISNKLKELEIWTGDETYSSIFNNNISAITEFKRDFKPEDVVQVMQYKQKYLSFRLETSTDFLCLSYVFRYLDEILKELFDFFKDTNTNEFERFETKTIEVNSLEEAVNGLIENKGENVTFSFPNKTLYNNSEEKQIQTNSTNIKNELTMQSPSSKDNYEYDIALSFAGEERYYVEVVAKELNNNNIKVFYDEYEKVDMWGKNLHDHLAKVYSNKALFCVIFISHNYAKKVWTNHERRSAQSRAIRQNQEYILPARFDDTEIVGLVDVSYIDLTEYTAYEFAELVMKKLSASDKNRLKSRLKEYVPKSVKFDYKLDFHNLKILEGFLDSKYRYRAITKISNDVALEEESLRERLNFLKTKGLVDIISRPKGNKWAITNDGKEYIEYYYHDLDESSGSFYFKD